MKNKKLWIWLSLSVVFLGLIIWVLWANAALELTEYAIEEDNLPAEFDGFRIAHVSDLHSTEFGKDHENLIRMLSESEPDIICITGDLMDSRSKRLDTVLSFARQAARIAPCYYITGNHEWRLGKDLYQQLMDGLEESGVIILSDEEVILRRGEEAISLAGHAWGSPDVLPQISAWDGYRILLSHPPEDFDRYVAAEFDLVLSGHAHGGQFRLPFVGGLYAPGQGLFPKYDAGVFREGRTDLVVSRGLGNSSFPLRFNNRPELVILTLHCG